MSSYMKTYTGRYIDPTDPDPAQICIEDIAHALSLICRGNGHVRTFWSVGQHCICCAREAAARGLSKRMVLACLLHDAGECYLSDVPRPFKDRVPAYRGIENSLLGMIYERFLGSDLTAAEAQTVREIDDAMLWYDLRTLFDEVSDGPQPVLHITPDYTVRDFTAVEIGRAHV